jgi:hypothetical protein
VRREAQEKRYALGASAIASASDRAVGVTGAPAGARARAQAVNRTGRAIPEFDESPAARKIEN